MTNHAKGSWVVRRAQLIWSMGKDGAMAIPLD